MLIIGGMLVVVGVAYFLCTRRVNGIENKDFWIILQELVHVSSDCIHIDFYGLF